MFGMPPGFGFPVIDNASVIISSSANGTGVFIYNGPPGVGNLISSLAATGVTADPFGNTVKGGGIAIYSGTNTIFLGPVAGATELIMTTGAAFESSTEPANLFTSLGGVGAAQVINLGLSGPATNVTGAKDWVQVQLASNNEGGTSIAGGRLNYISNAQVAQLVAFWNSLGFTIETNLLFFTGAPKPAQQVNYAQMYCGNQYPNVESGLAGDTNAYDICKIMFSAAGQALTTSQVAITGISGIGVGILTYEVHALLWFTNTAGVPTLTVTLNGPAVTTMRVKTKWTQVSVANTIVENVFTTQGSPTTSPAMTATGTSILELDGRIVFSASGATFGLSAACSVVGPSIDTNSYLTLEPVS